MNETYGEKYYRNNNYASYLERGDRYKRMVEELHHDLFRRINLHTFLSDRPVLDFGCAVGFTVKALQGLGYSAYGYDVSKWATDYAINVNGIAAENILTDLQPVTSQRWGLVLALDVLEHIDQVELAKTLTALRTKYLLVRVPVCHEDGGQYVLDVSENDPTHIIRMKKDSWTWFLRNCGFETMFTLNLGNIYDSEGVLCALYKVT